MLRFDISVELGERLVPQGMPPDLAVERVRKAVGNLTGAGKVLVAWNTEPVECEAWVKVHLDGSAEPVPGAPGAAVTALVKTTVRKALFTGLTMI